MKKFKDLVPMNLQFFAEGEGEGGSENTQEVAAPETEGGETEPTETESVTEEAAEPQPQSPEVNAAFADMRRRMEAAERKAAEIDSMYAKQFGGYKNPETGQPIKSAADYMEAMAAQERIQARQKLQESNIDPNLIDNLIANSPAVRQAQAATAELNNYRAQQKLEADYKEILALDPSLNGIDDILNDPSMPLMTEKVAQGMSLVDAYKIVNFDRVFNSKEAAIKQQTINQVKGKNHLSTGASVTVSSDLEDIPASMLEDFKDRFPDKSPKELKKLYNMAINSQRG